MKMEPTVTKFSNPEQQNIVIETTNNSGHEPGVSLNVAPRPDLEKLPPRRRGEGSTAGDIFKVELFDESEGSLYGV